MKKLPVLLVMIALCLCCMMTAAGANTLTVEYAGLTYSLTADTFVCEEGNTHAIELLSVRSFSLSPEDHKPFVKADVDFSDAADCPCEWEGAMSYTLNNGRATGDYSCTRDYSSVLLVAEMPARIEIVITRAGEPDHALEPWKYLNENQHSAHCTRQTCTSTTFGVHKGGTANCQERAVCSFCERVYGTTDPDNHRTVQILPAVPATVESAGLTEGKRCLDCGVDFVPQKPTPRLPAPDVPATGDSAVPVMWLLLALISLGGAMLLRRKAA